MGSRIESLIRKHHQEQADSRFRIVRVTHEVIQKATYGVLTEKEVQLLRKEVLFLVNNEAENVDLPISSPRAVHNASDEVIDAKNVLKTRPEKQFGPIIFNAIDRGMNRE